MNATLSRIDHFIVLMLENRSFDHLLDALTLEGVTYPVHPRPATPLRPDQDPPHDGAAVTEQLADAKGGFVRS